MSLLDLAQRLPRLWYRKPLAPSLYPLLPLSWLFRGLVCLRRGLYGLGVIRSCRLPVPVVVVGKTRHDHMPDPSRDAAFFEFVKKQKVVFLLNAGESRINFGIHCLYV